MRMLLKLAGPMLGIGVPCLVGLWGNVPFPVLAMMGVVCWMAVWWFTEAVHHAVTAFIPLLALPLLGICDSKTTAMQYTDPIVFLFMGGFILALAMERWNLHQRLAMYILSGMGSSPPRILLGVMLASYLISMWISNTATVMMLLPAVLAVVTKLQELMPEKEHARKFSAAVLLGLSYAATIGGMATPVGTPTNMIFMREYSSLFPNEPSLSFPGWMTKALPVSAGLFLGTFWILRGIFIRKSGALLPQNYFTRERRNLGRMSYEEKVVLGLFGIAATLWFTRADMQFGFAQWKGWSAYLGYSSEMISDATVAMGIAILLFVIPSKTEPDRSLMEWDEASRLPFDVVLLFGGGFAMAKGVEASGLGSWMAGHLQVLSAAPVWMILLGVVLLITLISEFASNVACIQLMLPVLAAMQPSLNLTAMELMFPATLAASMGFMMPVATAPNTIVYGTGYIRMREILLAGLLIDVLGIAFIVLLH